MIGKRLSPSLGLLVLLLAPEAPGQAPAPPVSPPTASRVAQADRRRQEAGRATAPGHRSGIQGRSLRRGDRPSRGTGRPEARAQGPKHFETVSAQLDLDRLRGYVAMPRDNRVAYRSALTMHNQATALFKQQKYAEAQPLYERVLEIRPTPLHRRPHLHRLRLPQPGDRPRRTGEVRRGPTALREGAGHPPTTPHRRSPRHRGVLRPPGDQSHEAGELRPGPATLRAGTGDHTFNGSATTDPKPPTVTATWP